MAVPNKSIREKSAARLMAVQLAYSHQSLSKAPNAEAMLADVKAFSFDEDQMEFTPVFKEKPHAPTLKRLLETYAEHKEVVAAIALESLNENWKAERVNPLLLIILEMAIVELDHQRELNEAVIIDEYTNIAARLLDASDVDFIHANVKRLAENLRH